MQAPNTMYVRCAHRACEKDVEGSQIGGQLCSLQRGEEIVWRETSGMERTVIGCEAAQ